MKVFIVAAITVDGFIARHVDELADWTSGEDKRQFVRLTKGAGTMVMGATTFKTIGRALPDRETVVYTSKPDEFRMEHVEPTSETPERLVGRLRQEGRQALAVCGGASIYTQFLQAGVVDELYLTVEPHLFGSGVALFNSSLDAELELLGMEHLNERVVSLHYALKRR